MQSKAVNLKLSSDFIGRIKFSKDYIEKIFEKFVQVKGSEDKGTGLGLVIAKEIVEALGGEIWCESKLGEGSTFTFTLSVYEEI